MKKLNLKPGDKKNRLTLVEPLGRRKNASLWWRAQCDCGNFTEVTTTGFNGNYKKSCGCLAIDTVRELATTHGKSKTPEYIIWTHMITRCTWVKGDRYADWGGRGITICERWRESFEAFLEDMGPRPSKNHSLERINNDLEYCPGNCRWATRLEQGQNKRNNIYVIFDGVRLSIAEASRRAGVNAESVYGKIKKKNVSPQEAFDHYAANPVREPVYLLNDEGRQL